MARHTEGPWTVRSAGCADKPPYVRVAKYWPGAGAYQIIADCSYEATHGSECEGNARVIAAAPEMLAALKEAARCVYALENILRAKAKNDPEGRRELGECCAAYALIDAALAKAEGRAA